jgi:hypothetical protein
MSQLEALAFEMPRRPVRFFSQTILPDGNPMNYTKNPNDAVNGLTDGDTLVYTSPMGTLFQMDDGTYYYKKSTPNTWEVVGTGTGGGTLSGATNGLGLADSGTTVTLGGDLTSGTTINGLGTHDFTFNNINDFQITPSGSSAITFGIDENGLLFTFTGGSVSYDSNAGLVYGGDYSTAFINESLVSKRYVDTIAAGLHPKTAVLVTTTGETLALSGLTTVDGVSLTTGDRVLVKDQTNDVENGIYVVTGGTWSRSTDFDGSPDGEVEQGALVPVISGDTNNSTQWILITKDPVVGTSGLTFTLFSTGKYTGGIGIDISGSEISVDGASLVGNSLSWTANTFNVDPSTGTLNTALNAKLDSSDFTTFTGTTLPNNYYNETEINSYTATTSGLINGKLDATTFTSYTGATQPVIDSALTGATNGLCVTGRDVYLGGELSQSTTICSNGNSFNLNNNNEAFNRWFFGDTYSFLQHRWMDTETYSGQVNITTTALDSVVSLCATTSEGNGSTSLVDVNGIGNITLDVEGTGPNTHNYLNFHATGITVIDAINETGMVYGGDYENNFTARSLVTKQYVSGVTSGITGTITGGTNGLGTTGADICLGGTLSNETTIDTTGYNFNICNSGAGLTNIEHINGSDCALIRAFATGVGGTVLLCATDLMTFCFGGSAIFNSPSNGWACYSSAAQPAAFTANAIPNVGYVSGYTQSAVTQNSNVLTTYEVSTTSYTATTSSDFIGASGGTTIYLPDAPKQGQRIVVADIGGDALSSSIVICSNTLQIVGGQSATINTDYGSITFIHNGTFWSTAAFIN